MSRMEKREYAAYTIRPKIRRMLPAYLEPVVMPKIEHRFRSDTARFHTEVAAGEIAQLVASCDVDHTVPPSISFRGGRAAALRHLERFLENNLHRYGALRNNPVAHATSNLSPYLRHGMPHRSRSPSPSAATARHTGSPPKNSSKS